MNLFQSISGMLEIELICADIPLTLRYISQQGIVLENIRFPSALTVRALIARTDIKKVRAICKKQGDKLRIRYAKGIYWALKGLLRRPVLTVGILSLCLMALWLPTRVLFVQVSGNNSVSTAVILDHAAQSGVCFGASSRAVRSERIKNMLLEQIPQLQWVGVNTAGCVATIYVKENVQEIQSPAVSSTFDICAARDAFVTHVYATKGTISCKIGQAVKAGQVLIASHIPAGETMIYTGAAGEIYGDTIRQNVCITPIKTEKRRVILSQERKFSLIIGKNQINLHNGSGICSSSCVKIVKEDPLTLPGGFQLPVAIRTEYITYYETEENILAEESMHWLQSYSSDYTKQQMIAGKILSGTFTTELTDDLYTLQGDFTCNEMIGSITNEGLSHGEDR